LFHLAYEFHQYVPLEFDITSGSDNNPGMEENDELLDKSIYGGGKHKLYLILNL
jgi:hypothetical protein